MGRKHCDDCDDALLRRQAAYWVVGLSGYHKELKSTGVTAVTLWAASIVTIVMMLFYVVKLLTG